jgi:hypothetical protein
LQADTASAASTWNTDLNPDEHTTVAANAFNIGRASYALQ